VVLVEIVLVLGFELLFGLVNLDEIRSQQVGEVAAPRLRLHGHVAANDRHLAVCADLLDFVLGVGVAQGLGEPESDELLVLVGVEIEARQAVQGRQGPRGGRAFPGIVIGEDVVVGEVALVGERVEAVKHLLVDLEIVGPFTDEVAARAVELVEHLATTDLGEAVGRGIVDELERYGLGHEAQHEGHDGFARLGFLHVGPRGQRGITFLLVGLDPPCFGAHRPAELEVVVALLLPALGAGELELGHAQALVPRPLAVVVVAARIDELLVQEAVARVMVVVQGFAEELLVKRLLSFLDADRLPVLIGKAGHYLVVVVHIGLDVLEGDALGVLLAPVVERGADRLGAIEAGDVVAAEAAHAADGLLADVPLDGVGLAGGVALEHLGQLAVVLGQARDRAGAELALVEVCQLVAGQGLGKGEVGQLFQGLGRALRDLQAGPFGSGLLDFLIEQPGGNRVGFLECQMGERHEGARAVEGRLEDPLHQPLPLRLVILLAGAARAKLLHEHAQVGAEGRLVLEVKLAIDGGELDLGRFLGGIAQIREQAIFGAGDRVVGMAGETALLGEEAPAVLDLVRGLGQLGTGGASGKLGGERLGLLAQGQALCRFDQPLLLLLAEGGILGKHVGLGEQAELLLEGLDVLDPARAGAGVARGLLLEQVLQLLAVGGRCLQPVLQLRDLLGLRPPLGRSEHLEHLEVILPALGVHAVEVVLALAEKVVADGVDLGVGEALLAVGQDLVVVGGEAVEVGHAGRRPVAARRLDPALDPVGVGLVAEAVEAGADLAQGAREVLRIGQGFGAVLGGQVAQGRQGLEAHVGANRAAALHAGDLMTAEAAQLANEVVAARELGGLVAIALADEVGDLVVALEALGFHEAHGLHGELPVVVGFPAVVLLPLFLGVGVVGRVRGVEEAGSAALAAVAGGAAELLGGVGAVGIDEKVEAGMGTELVDLRIGQVDGFLAQASGQALQLLLVGALAIKLLGLGVIGLLGGEAFLDVRVQLLNALFAFLELEAQRGVGERAQGILVVAGAIDAEVAGHAAVEARDVLEVVVDGKIGEGELVDLQRGIEGVQHGQRAKPVIALPAFLLGELFLEVEVRAQLLDEILRGFFRFFYGILVAQEVFHLLLVGVGLGLGFFEAAFEIGDLLAQRLGPIRVRSVLVNLDIEEAFARVEVGLDGAGPVVAADDGGLELVDVILDLVQFVLVSFEPRVGPVECGLGGNQVARVGHPVEGEALGHQGFDVAESTLLFLPFAIVVVREHPHDADQQEQAGHAEDRVQRFLVAIGLVAGCHGIPRC